MPVHRMRPRPLDLTRIEEEDAEDLADFVTFLLDALEIPEIAQAVRQRLGLPPLGIQGSVPPAAPRPASKPRRSGRH